MSLDSPNSYLKKTHCILGYKGQTGILSYLLTLDHKRIGVMYLISTMTAFLVAGLLALGVRTELLSPEKIMVTPQQYNRMFTLHGAIMIFLFIIPSVPAALGNIILPIMLGAKDVAFPRLNLLSYWLWIVGAVTALVAISQGGIDTGWTFYTPYSTSARPGVIAMAVGVFILGFSSIFTGLNFMVTMHKLRPPGMTWFRMPLFLWALYATALMQIIATPVLGITVVLLGVENIMGVGIFDPKLGGDPVLFQHFFWFYSHPAVYIMIVPGFGIISDVISIHARKHIFGYSFIAFSSVAIAILSFLVWGHHMFTSGQSTVVNVIFSALTFTISIPTAVKIYNWIATLYKGSIQFTTPMLYALAFIFLFTIGGLTGFPLATLATDVHLHDTYFVVAHFHYVMMGGLVIAMLAGLHHWWPKFTGRMYSETWGRVACALIFVGFNITFLTQFLMGAQGMPRRYYTYVPEYQIYHQTSTAGSYVLGLGFLVMLLYLVHSLFKGRPAPANPWGGATLEWRCSSPPRYDNFETTPTVGDPYDFSDLRYDPSIGGWISNDAPVAAGKAS
ncbi:MAG: cytochrome c oxidase subunit I [Planctomycetota bacterium]|nr:MAG: cytochrome c oxidase subunit I [Planctomycetota bacterium]